MKYKDVKIEWFGHATFRISDKLVLYFDPYMNYKKKDADLVLITHSHFDHFDPTAIREVLKDKGKVVIPEDCISKIPDLDFVSVVPNQTLEVLGVKIETIPAYNLNKNYHTKASNWVGYVVEIEGVRIYHAGDTDFIPEMKNLKDIDVALIPIGGTYTMDEKEAAEAVNSFKPKVVIPMHYNTFTEIVKNPYEFAKLVAEGIKVEILEPVSLS